MAIRRPSGQQRFDVAVVGAGPAATAAALVACGAGATVGLVSPVPRRARGDLELLAGRSRAVVDALGVGEVLSGVADPCVGTVSRWAGAEFDERSSLLDPDGGGWIVDRARFDAALRAVARARGVSVVEGRVARVEQEAARRRARIWLNKGRLDAEEVVVAVGSGCTPVRQQIRRTVRHRMVALQVELPPAVISGLGRRLLVDRAPAGWWYAVANSSATVVVYCTDAATLGRGTTGVAQAWSQACRLACDWLPGAACLARPRLRAATIGTATPAVIGRVTIAGDSALAVDPLSGHGLTLALQAGLRCREDDYADWVAGCADDHARIEGELYRAACGPVDGPFWARRRVPARSVMSS